jgi:serine/threonine protein kinase
MDIKSENIFIQTISRIKLIDFGSSSLKLDYFSSYIGSLGYEAPECILGHPYKRSSADMWSLGVVFCNDHNKTS